jgi:hypothetical protein
MCIVADVHPEARDTRDIGPPRIHRESQHLIVKLPGLFDLLNSLADTNAVMV